jgi:hypothetical protein
MSSKARAAYEVLPPCTPEEIRLAKLPVVIRNGKTYVLDGGKFVPLKEAYEKAK